MAKFTELAFCKINRSQDIQVWKNTNPTDPNKVQIFILNNGKTEDIIQLGEGQYDIFTNRSSGEIASIKAYMGRSGLLTLDFVENTLTSNLRKLNFPEGIEVKCD